MTICAADTYTRGWISVEFKEGAESQMESKGPHGSSSDDKSLGHVADDSAGLMLISLYCQQLGY